MPIPPTYPGVYIEEVPSTVRVITGVSTSTTAFIGLAKKGPTDYATTIHSFADYERIFGGLWKESNMSYAIYQYFLNGGTDAVIVRVVPQDAKPVNFETEECPQGQHWDKEKQKCIDTTPPSQVTGLTVTTQNSTRLNLVWTANTDTDLLHYNVYRGKTAGFTVNTATAAPVGQPSTNSFSDTGLTPSTTYFYRVAAVDGSDNIGALSTEASGATKAPAEPPEPPRKLILEASNPGLWAKDLKITVEDDDINTEINTTEDPLFNIVVENTELPEKFYNISSKPDNPQYITTVLKEESNLIRIPKDKEPAEGKMPSPVDKPLKIVEGSGSDGTKPLDITGSAAAKTGIYALDNIDHFNMLCIPPYNKDEATKKDKDIPTGVYDKALDYCKERHAMLIVDSPSSWDNKEAARTGIDKLPRSKDAAIFFPHIKAPDPLQHNRLRDFVPCGAVAGVIARIDSQRGVWKAPAGIEANLIGVSDLDVRLTDAENGELNQLGINCLRILPAAGRVVWGSRTMRGADRLADQWKYLPVRRTALFIEESLYRGTQWVVFEPNDEPLWAQIRLNVGAFMDTLFRQGAFQGKTAKEAYLVKCDSETTTQNDINLGIVNIVVGFAPLKPAEFVVIKLQQMAGQIQV